MEDGLVPGHAGIRSYKWMRGSYNLRMAVDVDVGAFGHRTC